MIPLRIWWLSVAAAAAFSFASLPPASAQTPPVAAAPNDPFGKEVSLVEKNIVYVAGSGMWESAFSTIVAGFKTVYGAMAKQGLKASGAPMTIYTAKARFPLRMTPEGVKPGSTGTIFDVEQLPTLAGPGPKVRVQIDDYKSDWIFPAQLEILTATAAKADWYIERWVAGGTWAPPSRKKRAIQLPTGLDHFRMREAIA
jgi:hypothetical protein